MGNTPTKCQTFILVRNKVLRPWSLPALTEAPSDPNTDVFGKNQCYIIWMRFQLIYKITTASVAALVASNRTYHIFVIFTDTTVKWSYKFRVWQVSVYDQPLISFVHCYSCGCIQLSLAALWFSSFKALLLNWNIYTSF